MLTFLFRYMKPQLIFCKKKTTSSLKNIALTLFIFRFKQFFGVQVVKSIQLAIIPDAKEKQTDVKH